MTSPLASLDRVHLRVAVALIAGVIVAANFAISPDRFYDYFSYLTITDQLYYFRIESFLEYEIAANLMLLGLREATGNTETAVILAHFLLGAIFVALSYLIAAREKVDWRAMLFFFSMYGPLLAFVTLRATPAYLLVAWSALMASRGRLSSIPLAASALLFHVTAALAVPPLLVVLLQNRYDSFRWIARSGKLTLVIAAVMAITFVLFRETLVALIIAAIESIPFLDKYSRYTTAIDVTAELSREQLNLTFHYAYSACALLFATACLFINDERLERLRGYIVISAFIFVFMQFSPPPAYRQSLYWMIPAIFAFPWRRFAPAGLKSVVLVLVCVGLFAMNMSTVYE